MCLCHSITVTKEFIQWRIANSTAWSLHCASPSSSITRIIHYLQEGHTVLNLRSFVKCASAASNNISEIMLHASLLKKTRLSVRTIYKGYRWWWCNVTILNHWINCRHHKIRLCFGVYTRKHTRSWAGTSHRFHISSDIVLGRGRWALRTTLLRCWNNSLRRLDDVCGRSIVLHKIHWLHLQ